MEKQFDIVDTVLSSDNLSTLAAALGAAGLLGALKSDGPFTVFAPTDDAFAKIPPQALSELLQPENKAKLAAILTYHVVPGRMTADEVVDLDSATTLQGQTVKIDGQRGVTINESTVIAADVEATNGVIHFIDTVLMPTTGAAA